MQEFPYDHQKGKREKVKKKKGKSKKEEGEYKRLISNQPKEV